MNEIFKFDSGYFEALVWFAWFAWIGTGIVVAAAIGLEITRSNDAMREDDEKLPQQAWPQCPASLSPDGRLARNVNG